MTAPAPSFRRPWAAWAFLALGILATGAVLAQPALVTTLGGFAPRQHPWQLVTSAFVHGWWGFSPLVHLALTAPLVLGCGLPAERALGTRRFVLLTGAALGAHALVQLATGGANGPSLVIWAWGVPLGVAVHRARSAAGWTGRARRLAALLGLMYLVIPAGMAAIPYLGGWRGNPLVSLAVTNVYHLAGAAVGAVFAWRWRESLGLP